MKRLLLLSGGIDSTALAAWRVPEAAIVIDYGQLPAKGEIRSAKCVASVLSIPLNVVTVNCSAVGSGLLSGTEACNISPSKEWWPYRNQLLVTLAGAWAINNGFKELILASVKTDGFHVDGTREFYKNIDSLMHMQEGQVRVTVPAIDLSSIELIRKSEIGEEILSWTHSCHECEWACGVCPGCLKRQHTFSKLLKAG